MQIAVSALPLKGAPVCSKFFVRDMLGRGDITLRHTTSALAAPPLHVLSHERVTSGAGGVTVCPVRHALHVGSGMTSEPVQVSQQAPRAEGC